MTRAGIFRITLVSDNFFFIFTCPAGSSKHPAILHTKSSNKIYLWLEGSLVSQPNVCGRFSGKLVIFFAIKEVYTKSFFLLIALVENLNANNMNLLAAAADIDVMTCRNKEWSFELFRTQNTSI